MNITDGPGKFEKLALQQNLWVKMNRNKDETR